MRRIARQNASVVKQVAATELRVHAQTARMAEAVARRQRVTAAVAVERDQVESLRLAVLEHEPRPSAIAPANKPSWGRSSIS